MSIITGSIAKINVPDDELHRRILERFNNGDTVYVNGISGYSFAYINETQSTSTQIPGTFIINKKIFNIIVNVCTNIIYNTIIAYTLNYDGNRYEKF